MVLYCIDNQCVFYQTLMHRFGCNKEKEAVLFVREGMNVINYIKPLKKYKIFSDIIEMPLLYNRRRSDNASVEDIINYFDNIFSKIKYKLSSFENIYMINDYWDGDINLYFNLKKIYYTWIQITPNLIDFKPQYVSKTFSDISICYKSHTPFAEFARPCLLKSSSESQKRLLNKGFTTWDLKECLNELTEEQLDIMAECYGVDLNEFTTEALKGSALILLNSYGYSVRSLIEYKYNSEYIKNILGFDESLDFDKTPYAKICSIMTRLAIDFYVPKATKYFIKLHPNEPALSEEELKQYYGDNALNFTSMPFELVGRLFQVKKINLDTLLTYAHGVDGLPCFNNIVLGDSFCFTWFYYCSIYVSLLYALKAGFKTIYCSKCLIDQINFLIKRFKFDLKAESYGFIDILKRKISEKSFYLYNSLDEEVIDNEGLLDTLDSDSVVAFLNVDLTKKFFSANKFFNFVEIEIEKESTSSCSFNLERKETLWIYSKKRILRDLALSFEYTEDLNHSGYTINVKKHSISESTNTFLQLAYLNELRNISEQTSFIQKLLNVTINKDNVDIVIRSVNTCDSLSKYVELLNVIKEKYLIIE